MSEETGEEQKGSGITEQQARKLIYDFLKMEGDPNTRDYIEANLELTGMREHPNLGQLYSFDGELGEFWVSRERGKVVKYNGPPALTAAEAEDFAGRFIRRHIPDFESRNFRMESSEADGQFWREEWREYPQGKNEISIFPNWISISVNLEKRAVHNFSFSDLRRIRYNQPGIDEEKARRKVMEKFPDGKILEIELLEHTSDGGQNWVTIWNVVVSPGDDEDEPNEIISIDADTGTEVPL
ncbi:MAG: hypothetical protein GF417_07010 [Candidatus Latescibacteria bacterium]|nr:hypothetical protein [bacterium]MBD3424169.1 hypothetical protein [Candidatus Latescibacterota bacterium]